MCKFTPLKKRKRAFQDPSKYPSRTSQNHPRRHLDPQGPLRSSQGLSGTSLGPSQMPQDPPPRPPRTPQNPLGPFQDLPRTLKHPLRTSQNPAAAPRTCSRTAQDASMIPRPEPPEQGQNLFMTPQAPSLQPPSLQRPRRDSRSDNNLYLL